MPSPVRASDQKYEAVGLLSLLPEENRDRLFPVLSEGPAIYEELSGRRPHRSMLWRHVRKGVAGQFLRTVSVGGTLMSTPRWVVEFWMAVDASRRGARSQA